METYKTLKQLETDSHNMPLDHVMNHPFFAKKSSLQEKKNMAISKPKEGDGHNHSSETMNQYKGEHEKNGMDVTKSKPKARPKESGNLEQQKNAHASYDIDELELDEACGCEDIDSKRVDGRTKAYRETYTRIMNRLGKLREKNQKQAKEGWGGKGGVPGKGTVTTVRPKKNGGMNGKK